MPLKIAIIGAGPAGCMLARLLQHRAGAAAPIDVTIFESESRLDVRSQGGTLDLHVATGQAALKAAGLYDAFLQHARFDGEALQIADKRLLRYVRAGASAAKSTTGRPEIDRPALRQLLHDSLAPGTVRWGCKVARVDAAARTVHFADGSGSGSGSASGFDLIVGADGAWSRVRPAVSAAQPVYSGVTGFSFVIPDAARAQPELYRLANRGSLFAFSDAKSIMGQYMGDGSINTSAWLVRGEDWQREHAHLTKDAEAMRKAMRDEFHDWDPRLVAFTQTADAHVVARNLYMLPVGHKWAHVPGVTLVGDAAHLMTPFAGEGVNLALTDVVNLSDAILSAAAAAAAAAASVANNDDRSLLDSNVATFEREMFTRAAATQQMTVDMMNAMFFTPGAPRNGIEKYVLRAITDEMGTLMTAVVTPLVYIWFFVFKLIW